MKQYLDAVRTVLNEGERKENRSGVDTISTFAVPMRFDLRDGFPLLTTKKINWKNIVVENLWFLSGEPHIGLLHKHKCKFWDAWADEDGMVPSAYGNFWRHFPVHEAEGGTWTEFDPGNRSDPYMLVRGWNDQVAWAIDMLKNKPMARNIVISAWAPGNAQTSKLPPCHVMMVFNVQMMRDKCPECKGTGDRHPPEAFSGLLCPVCDGDGVIGEPKQRLCLHLTQRSCDIALGVPYNIAGYAFLLELFSRFSGLKPGIFSHMLVDAHAYTSNVDGSMVEKDQIPGLKEQLTREPRALPRLKIAPRIQNLDDITQVMDYDTKDVMKLFQLEGYDPHPPIGFKVVEVGFKDSKE